MTDHLLVGGGWGRRASLTIVPRRRALGLLLLSLAAAAGADEVLIRGPGTDVVVTAADVRAEIAAAPGQLRQQMTADRDSLAEAINNLYQRKALVGAAMAAGLDQSPAVQAQLVRARDLVFTNAIIEDQQQQLIVRIPDMAARAQEVYQAQPERYLIPARIRARHLLLRADTAEARTARRAQAEGLLKQLREGADFAALAKQSSEDTTAEKGGELPPFTRGQMVKPFEDAAFALKQPGDLSPVVESPFGLHLIRLEEIQSERLRPFEQVKESIVAKLRQDWVVEAHNAWRQGIVDPAKARPDQTALDAFMTQVIGAASAPNAALQPDTKGR